MHSFARYAGPITHLQSAPRKAPTSSRSLFTIFVLAQLPCFSLDSYIRDNTAPNEYHRRNRGQAIRLCCVIPAGGLNNPQVQQIIHNQSTLLHGFRSYPAISLISILGKTRAPISSKALSASFPAF